MIHEETLKFTFLICLELLKKNIVAVSFQTERKSQRVKKIQFGIRVLEL